MAIKVIIDGKDITSLINKVSWGGEDSQVSRKLEFSLANDPYDKKFYYSKISAGSKANFYDNNKEKFTGRVLTHEQKSEIGTVEYTCRDYLYTLQQSTATYKFKNRTPEYIARAVCKDFGVSVGKMPRTHHRLKKYIPSDMSPYNIILKAFQMVEKYTHKKYMIKMDGEKLCVIEKGKLIEGLKLMTGANVESAEYNEDAADVVNAVAVYNSKGQKIGSYRQAKSIKKYGIVQANINVDKGKGKKQAKSAVKGIAKTANITCIGNVKLVSGYAVMVKAAGTKLNGKYYIKSDTHTWENGVYKTDLEIKFTNSDESISYSKISSNSSKTTNADGSVVKTTKKTYKAYFTAYSETTGTRKDCKGHKLNAAKHTCASAKSIPYGTKMIAYCPGTIIDKKTYKCTDRPKNGRLKGKLHVDILMKTDAECKRFGHHEGKVTIIKKTVIKAADDGDKMGKKIAEKALTRRGCKYVWGATGPNTFDCSGLVWWTHRKLGINFKRTSAAGLAGIGSKVSYGNLQAGDVVLFRNSSKIHHTGIYIGNGKFVHAPHSGDVVKVSQLKSGYYRNEFCMGRRIR